MNTIEQRRELEREQRRAEIVAAAADLALAQGWDEVTIERVAKRAGLSRALVYLYFRHKRDLHAAMWEVATQILHERFVAAVARHQRGYDQIEAMGRAYVAFAQEFPHYFEAISRFEAMAPDEMVPGSGEARALACNLEKHGLMVEVIARGIADGSIRADAGEPSLVSIALWGFTHGIMQIAATKGKQLTHIQISESALIEQAFVMMRRSLAANAESKS